MSRSISPLVGSAVSWMYGNRDLLNKGYSGKDPEFKEAKAAFMKDMTKGWPQELEESLMQAFEAALNMV